MDQYEETVLGMTCAHCAKAVDEAVSALDAVRSVQVDLGSGLLRVDVDPPLDLNELADAIAWAGYQLVPVPLGEAASG